MTGTVTITQASYEGAIATLVFAVVEIGAEKGALGMVLRSLVQQAPHKVNLMGVIDDL